MITFFLSFILLFNAACVREAQRDHNLPNDFSDQMAKTLYETKWFHKKIGDTDWINSDSLTKEDLKALGALEIKTASSGEEVKNSFSQAGTFVDPNSQISFINRYYKLDYDILNVQDIGTDLQTIKKDPLKLLAFLLGDVGKFYGFPGQDYYILPHFVDNFLVLYRLGTPDTIPYDQLPLAKKAGDFLATPLVGYSVQYCNAEKDKDDYGEKTDLDIPIKEAINMSTGEYPNRS